VKGEGDGVVNVTEYLICIHKNRIMRLFKTVFKREGIRKNNRGDEYNQSTLYVCMKISQ
jgi:hypothetical protein